jgi:hypothetical protein
MGSASGSATGSASGSATGSASGSERKKRSLVLIGLMGSGKTTVGRRLAKRLGINFIDSDREIEKAADCSVADIFDLHGEAAFRVFGFGLISKRFSIGLAAALGVRCCKKANHAKS